MIQQRNLHERLPTSSDFDEFSKDWCRVPRGTGIDVALGHFTTRKTHLRRNRSYNGRTGWKIVSCFTRKKNTTRKTNERYRGTHQTASGIVSCIQRNDQELGTYLHARLVEYFLSAICLSDDCALFWLTLLRGNRETTLNIRNGEDTVLCCTDNFVLLVAVTMQRATPSLDTMPTRHDPARVTLCHGKEVEATMLTLLEPFSEGMIDDDAALIRKYPSTKMEATPSCESNTSFDVADPERDPDAEAQKGKTYLSKKRANDTKPKRDHNVFTRFPESPNRNVCRMTKTTRASRSKPLKRAAGSLLQPHSKI